MVWHKRSCCSAPIRSCMLCSAGANNMRSEQWQTISDCPHFLLRFRLISWIWYMDIINFHCRNCLVVNDNNLLVWHIKSCMLCSPSANGSHQGQQPISVWRHATEYLDRKKLVKAVDGLTERKNFKSFLSFRRYSQPYVHCNKLSQVS